MAETNSFLEDTDIKVSNELARQERINKELSEANQNYKEGNIEKWKENLDILYREMYHKIKELKKEEEFKKILNDINRQYEDYSNKPQEETIKKFYEILNKLDIKLREIINKDE